MSIFVIILLAMGTWALGLVLMFVTGKVLSRATLVSIEQDDPNEVLSEASRRLRAVYRRIVNIAGMYWYVSLPFVAIIVVGVTIAILNGLLTLGRIPVYFIFVLVMCAVMSLNAMVRSLFVRVRDDVAPGRAITEAEAPGLWAMTREVASVVGTRPIDEIWLTPGTELAVFERGSANQRMKDRAPRALLIGAGVLDGFEQGAFRAVLAHEYGHFEHRDTAGGEVALHVTNGMMTLAIAIGKAGYAVWWNLTFQFLRLYNFLFRRISHGATRLQEVLADRVAVQHYGLDAFRTGLTHVVRRSILFKKFADDEIRQAIEQRRGLPNLYTLPATADNAILAELEQQVSSELEKATSEDNTHPSPRDRFLLGQRIRSTPAYQADGYVWDLFLDRATITAEMTSVIAKGVAEQLAAPIAVKGVPRTSPAPEPAVVTIKDPVVLDENEERIKMEIEEKSRQLTVLRQDLAPLKARRKKLNIFTVSGGAVAGVMFAGMVFPEAIVIGLLLGIGGGFLLTRLYFAVNSEQRDITNRLDSEMVLSDEIGRIQECADFRPERVTPSSVPTVKPSLEPDETVFQCPACGTSYRLSDYRADVAQIYCAGCKVALPR